ncbi:glycine--tRNA ligase subunit beta [Buchnera aphidicola]|uniref:glycine--tRNA ligase subunit beta n=1 Tax=Buchnera aphidicola TaxID=9 RepID=UPI0034646C00
MEKILLVEIGTEELPAKKLRNLILSFSNNIIHELNSYNIKYKKIISYATPRRLAVKIKNINPTYTKKEIKKKGPSILHAFDHQGHPTDIALNWAKSCGINLKQAKRIKKNKREWLCYTSDIKEESIDTILPKIITVSIKNIKTYSFMKWTNDKFKFSRPIRNISVLLEDKIIDMKIFDIQSDRILRNHLSIRNTKIIINHANQYPNILFKKAKIIAHFSSRKEEIKKYADLEAKKINGILKYSDSLLEEITALVESPVALIGKFDEKFLILPHEILIHIMTYNQKYFPVYNTNKKLMPYFVFITNIQSYYPQCIISGNENVIHARFKDAEFFFRNDIQKKLEDYLPTLKNISFQKKLGSLYDKTSRIISLITWIAPLIYANVPNAIRAATLSKCDLTTNMVFEFPEIQGIIGMYYAINSKENKEIAIAIKEHYQPRFSGDKLPSNLISCALAIADKIDTLSGIFSIGEYPKGDKDPYALKRAAVGIIRIIISKKILIDLKKLLNKSINLYETITDKKIIIKYLTKFILERCYSFYHRQGYSIDIIRSVLSCNFTQLVDIDERIKAIAYFQKLKNYKSLILVNKRICKFLEKNNKKTNEHIDVTLIKDPSEMILNKKIKNLNIILPHLFFKRKYKEALFHIVTITDSIELFFNSVVINHIDPDIRTNRLTILYKINKIFLNITNFSYLTIID